MPSDNKQLTITIGATLSAAFNSVISGSTSKLNQVGTVIATLSAAFNSVISGSTSKLNQVGTVIKGLEKYGENHSVILHIPY